MTIERVQTCRSARGANGHNGANRKKSAMVVAIANQKGGVAKTTTCLSLGGALAELGHSVLLMDLDPQASLTLSLGFNPAEVRHTALDTLLGHHSLVGVSRESAQFGLDIVPASRELIVLDSLMQDKPEEQLRLRRKLDIYVKNIYNFVLIDCPPSGGNLTLNALAAADLLIIPIQCEFYAAHSLRQTFKLVQRVREEHGIHLKWRILITLYDMRNKICRLIRDQLEGALNSMLFETVIQIDTKLRESPVYAKPITAYASRSRGAAQYRALAAELLALPEPTNGHSNGRTRIGGRSHGAGESPTDELELEISPAALAL
jgi:chromosome partitioning protein